MRNKSLRRGNAERCTQGTVKDILFNLTEDVQFKCLCDMAAGKLTATDIRKQLVKFGVELQKCKDLITLEP